MKFQNFKDQWSDAKFNNTFADSSVVCRDVEIKDSTLGHYSRLKPFTEFRSSVLGDYSALSSYSIVNASVIGKYTSIGPGVFIGLWEHNQWVSTHPFYLTESQGEFVKGKPLDGDEYLPPYRSPEPKALEWAEKNIWFGKDESMTSASMILHKEIIDEGIEVASENYYAELDARIQKSFPENFSKGKYIKKHNKKELH